MKTAMIFATLLLATAGCWHHGYVAVSGPGPVVVIEDERAWDGQGWIEFHHHHHGPGCGHYYHHGTWHIFAESYVYRRPNYGHYGVRIQVEDRDHDRRSPAPAHLPEPPHPPIPHR